MVKPQGFFENSRPSNVVISFQSTVKELDPIQVIRMFDLDFSERGVNNETYSQQDLKFLTILRKGIPPDLRWSLQDAFAIQGIRAPASQQ